MKKLVIFLCAFLLLSCDNKYSYIEVVTEKGLMNESYTEKSLTPETITAKNDSLAYLKAYEKFCISIYANKKASEAIGKSFGGPSSFKLLNSDGLDVYAITDIDPLAIKEIENSILKLSAGNIEPEKKQTYYKGIAKGDTVVINNKEDWSAKEQKFINAKSATIHGNKRALTEEYLIKTFPNGTKGIVLDYYCEALSDGSEWRVFKLKVENSEGWIADFDIE